MDPLGLILHKLAVRILLIVFVFTYLCTMLWYNEITLPQSSLSISKCRFPYLYNTSLGNSPLDLSVLIDLTDFKFLLNNQHCDNVKNLFMIVFVHSAPQNVQKRQIIRKTWGSEKILFTDTIRLIFLIGSVKNQSLINAISEENDSHRDIVQGNFIDSYRNLTYKHVMGLKWITYFCLHAKYIVKTDDDIFVDVFQLTSYLKVTFGLQPPKNFILCLLIKKTFVRRSQRSKWRVTFKEYQNRYYPTYCAGWLIIMPPDVIYRLYFQSSLVPYFWIDDVHISGTLANQIGINHIDFPNNLYLGEDGLRKWLENTVLTRPPMFGQPIFNVSIIYQLWNKTLQYYLSVKSQSIPN